MTESVGNMKLALDNKMDKEQDELDKRQISASFLEVERGHIHLHIRHVPILSNITSKVGEALEDLELEVLKGAKECRCAESKAREEMNEVVAMLRKLEVSVADLAIRTSKESLALERRVVKLEREDRHEIDTLSRVEDSLEEVRAGLQDCQLSRRNNLIVHGLVADPRVEETQTVLAEQVRHILHSKLGISRAMSITRVARLGQSQLVLGCQPVLVTFLHHTQKEEVLRKAALLPRLSGMLITEDLPKASLTRLPSCTGSTVEEEEKKKATKVGFDGAKCKVLKQDCDLIEEEICKGAEDDIDGRSQYVEGVAEEVETSEQNGEQIKLINQQNQGVEYSKIDGQDGSGMMMKEMDKTTEIFCAKKEGTPVNTIKKEKVFEVEVGNGSECDKKDFDHNEENDFYPEVSQSHVVKDVKSFHGPDHQLDQNKETFVPGSDELEETTMESKDIDGSFKEGVPEEDGEDIKGKSQDEDQDEDSTVFDFFD